MTDLREVCGASWTYPSDPEEMAKEGLPKRWAGVTVTCDEPPHTFEPHEVTHSAPVYVKGWLRGTKYWGPGYTPLR
ncbi:hypothetical protein ACFY8B_22310 [Streptomyces sp. NPDC012751]|uniref:hypothetical protein n=1 Tax=Streptomyces sp. NPDC012751 TaxID=3364846 RepID=UPI0036ABCF77